MRRTEPGIQRLDRYAHQPRRGQQGWGVIDRDPESARFFRRVSDACPLRAGTRIEVTGRMHDDPDPMPVGSRGTVTGGNGAQLIVDWDCGRHLILLAEDPYRVLDDGRH